MKKVIFWDFDGTLAKSPKIWTNSLYNVLTNLNYKIDIEDVRLHLRTGYTWQMPEKSYTDNTGQLWWDRLFEHLDLFYKNHKVSEEDRIKANSDFKNSILDTNNYSIYEGAEVVLSKCTQMGYKNYILSNNFPELILIINGLGLAEYFIDYIISANIGYEKPRIEIFQYAQKIADFPDICYMIGDNPVADIQGGKSAGMKTILVHNNCISDADYTVENLAEIPLLLN